MKFGDIVLRKDEVSGEEYLEWSTERESKTRHGEENEHQRYFRPKAYETGDRKCLLIYLRYFHHNRETGCGGGRTTERDSNLSAPFLPSQT